MQLVYQIKDSFRTISESIKSIALLKDDARKNREAVKVRAELQQKYFAELKKEKLTQPEQALVVKIEKALVFVKPLAQQVIELGLADKDIEVADIVNNKAGPAIEALNNAADEFVKIETSINRNSEAAALKTYADSVKLLIVFSIFAVGLGILVGFIITRGITRPVNKIINALSEGANQVAAASEQLSASAQLLSEGSAEQASAIEETSSTLQQSSSALQQNNTNTTQATQLSEQAKELANKGNLEMRQMMNSMAEIKKSSNQIAKIIKVIDDIAFQTNILALNAAIEAARAGEAGMGFGVVAEEVRNLAQRSAQAAKDTTVIIEANINISGEGVKGAERVQNTLNEITNQAKKVSELMGEIAATSHEQLLGIEQVNAVMAQIGTVTEQNASNAEESAAAAEELSAQAENLNRVIQELSQLLINSKVNREKITSPVNQPPHSDQDTDSLTDKADKADKVNNRIKIVTPEDVIPLEKDSHQF